MLLLGFGAIGAFALVRRRRRTSDRKRLLSTSSTANLGAGAGEYVAPLPMMSPIAGGAGGADTEGAGALTEWGTPQAPTPETPAAGGQATVTFASPAAAVVPLTSAVADEFPSGADPLAGTQPLSVESIRVAEPAERELSGLPVNVKCGV